METERRKLSPDQFKYIEWLRTINVFGIYYHYESGILFFVMGLETPYSFPSIICVEITDQTDSGYWISNRGGGSLTPEQLETCGYVTTLTEEDALQSIKRVRQDDPDDPFEDYILKCKEIFIDVIQQEYEISDV